MALGVDSPVTTTLFGLLALVFLTGFVAVAYWLYHDARARGSKRPAEWVVNWLSFNWFAVAHYLRVRDRIGERDAPVTTRERGAASLVLGLVFALLAGSVFWPPDPLTQLVVLPLSLLVTLPFACATLLAIERVRANST